jgi:hypothetical protein
MSNANDSSPRPPIAPPNESVPGQKAKTPVLAWWGIIPAFLYIAIQVMYGLPDAKEHATAPEFAISYLVGRIIGGLLLSFAIAWIAYRGTRRSQRAATIAFSIMIALVCWSTFAKPRGQQPPDVEPPRPPAAPATPSQPVGALQQLVHPDHPVVVMVPEGWEPATGLAPPILLLAAEGETGNSLALLGIQVADKKFVLIREDADAGVMEELGVKGKILHRLDTKLLGLPAYCVIVETELQERKVLLARIMMEKPLNGFIYVVQFSKLSPGDLSPQDIPSIVDRVRLEK